MGSGALKVQRLAHNHQLLQGQTVAHTWRLIVVLMRCLEHISASVSRGQPDKVADVLKVLAQFILVRFTYSTQSA